MMKIQSKSNCLEKDKNEMDIGNNFKEIKERGKMWMYE